MITTGSPDTVFCQRIYAYDTTLLPELVVGGLGFEFCVFVDGWRHTLRSEWPFIIIIIIYAYDTTYDKYDEYDIRYEDLIWKKQQKTHEALVVKHSLQAQ